MERKIVIGIIGAGMIAEKHIVGLPQIRTSNVK
jgi:hypothetical protein